MVETCYTLEVPLRIALITDTHNGAVESIAASLEKNRPDMIAIAGDIIYGGVPRGEDLVVRRQKNVLPLLRICAGAAPTFMSLGNHEWLLCGQDLDLVRGTGVVLLDNEWTRWRDLVIGGLTAGYYTAFQKYRQGRPERYPRWEYMEAEPDLTWLPEFEKQEGFRLLLSHQPEYYPRYLAGRDIDLVLSGHAHGGQWRFFGRGLYAPGQGLFPKLTSGVHDGRLVISRGASNPQRLPRINNPPEIVYLLPPNGKE